MNTNHSTPRLVETANRPKRRYGRKIFIAVLLALLAGAGIAFVQVFPSSGTRAVVDALPTKYNKDFATLGEIPPPSGFTRIEGEDAAFARYLRNLPLKPKGSKVQLFTGGEANYQFLAYRVIDLPLLSNDEQCADVCMRLRAESLYEQGRYGSIRFRDVNGRTMRYTGGASRKAFERYRRRVYGSASTFSLKQEMKQRPVGEVQPGDVWVFAAGDAGHFDARLGHAIMVADVAEDSRGRRAVLLVEGNTPARSMHVLRNFYNVNQSPWVVLDEDDTVHWLAFFNYYGHELRSWAGK